MPSCQTFRDTLGKIKTEELQGLLKALTTSPSDADLTFVEKFQILKDQRNAFVKEYQVKARELLGEWTPNTENVYFEADTQRVIFKGNLMFDTTLSNPEELKGLKHFPSLIKAIEGSLEIKNTGITSLDYLETVQGEVRIADTPLTSASRLKEVGGGSIIGLAIINTKLTSLPSLETVRGGLFFRDNKPFSSLPQLKKVGGTLGLNDTSVVELPLLEQVDGNMQVLNRSFSSANMLRKVGGTLDAGCTCSLPLLEQVDGGISLFEMRPFQNTFPTVDIAGIFPNLKKVGFSTTNEGYSFIVSTEDQMRQLLVLKNHGKIQIDGPISVRKLPGAP